MNKPLVSIVCRDHEGLRKAELLTSREIVFQLGIANGLGNNPIMIGPRQFCHFQSLPPLPKFHHLLIELFNCLYLSIESEFIVGLLVSYLPKRLSQCWMAKQSKDRLG